MFYSILQPPPYGIEVFDRPDGSKLCAVAIARGVDEVRIVNVVAELSPFIRNDEEVWEFSFTIEVIALDDSVEPFQTQDREMAAPYIPAECRPAVMDVVCAELNALIAHVEPQALYMVSFAPHLPARAMPKYDRLINVLGDLDYYLDDQGEDMFGRTFWLLRR